MLAIIECVIAVAIDVSVGLHRGTFTLLAVSVAAAPLTLLRTEESSLWALHKYARVVRLLKSKFPPKSVAGIVLVSLVREPIAALVGFFLRIVTTFYWTIRRPLNAITEMPRNWIRQSLCTDVFTPPEIIPLENTHGSEMGIETFDQWFDFFQTLLMDLGVITRPPPPGLITKIEDRQNRQTLPGFRIFLVGLLVPFGLVAYLPALFYRVSFKATSVAYAPFVWVARATVYGPTTVKMRLERITKGELEKARRWLSGLIGTALVGKVALAGGWIDVTAAVAQFHSQKLVDTVLVPQHWPWWQITLVIDALVTFCLLFYADAAVARLDGPEVWREERIATFISTVTFLRSSLAIVTMSHFFYLAFGIAVARHIFR